MKYFLKDDFSYEAVVYPEPVHYLDNGKWVDVDNTLEETKDDSVVTEETTSDVTSSESKSIVSTGEAAIAADTTEETIDNAANKAEKVKDSKNVLKNKQNDYNVNFAKNSKSNKLVNIQKDNYSISWSIEGAEKTKAEAIAADITAVDNTIKAETEEKVEKSEEFKEFSTAQKAKAKETIIDNENKKLAPKSTSMLQYKGILPDVDLKYSVGSAKLKEDIIVNKYSKDFKITFNIDSKGLSARLEKDNTISFYDEKDPSKVIFNTAPPFMYDKNGESSNKVQVKLDKDKKGYKLTLIPDDTWM